MPISINLQDLEYCELYDKKTIITTVTNYGYLLYTLNMLKSLKEFGIDQKVFVVCIDKKSADILKKLGFIVCCVDEPELGKFCPWNTKGYDKICYLKLELIYSLLSLNKNVLLVDGDIVFRKSLIDDWHKWKDDTKYDIWIQNDSMENTNLANMCTGYMFIKCSSNLVKLYDCISDEGKRKYLSCAFDNNDQSYFNNFVKPYCKIKSLSLELYPNGQMYYSNSENLKDNVVLVHFNWVHGHHKMAKMKEHKMWLLTPEEEEDI
jgi:hypothetical protein